MNAKSFFGGLSLLLFLNLLVKPAWIFLVDRQVQNVVGHSAYGTYFSLFNLTYVLLFAADAGLTNFLTQRLSTDASYNHRPLLQLKGALLLSYAALCVLLGWLTGIAHWSIFLLIVLLQGLSSLYLFLRGLLASAQRFKADAVFSVLDKTLLILLCAGPVYGVIGRLDVPLFLRLQLVATVLATATLLVVCLRQKLFLFSASTSVDPVRLRQLLPFAAVILLMAAHYRLDGFLLERLRSDGALQAGIYAAAYRLVDAANMPGYLCASFLVPFLARRRNDPALSDNAVLIVRHGLLLLAFFASAFAWVFAPLLQSLLYRDLSLSNDVLRFCLAVLPAYGLVHVYGSVLTARGEFKAFVSVLAACVVVNVLLNVLLIPRYGALGCCFAALVSQYACAFVLWFVAAKKRLVPARWSSALLYPAWAAVCFGAFLLCQKAGNSVWIILAGAGLSILLIAASQKRRIKQFVSFLNS